MNEFQKVVKYLAMGFAAFLAITIITGITTAVLAISGVLNVSSTGDIISKTDRFSNVKSISIEHGVGTLTVKSGSSDQVEVIAENVSEDFNAKMNFSGDLKVNTKFNFFNIFNSNKVNAKVTILLPKDFTAENFEIDCGAGNINIDDLATKKLDINAGTGNIKGSRITAASFILDGGLGEISFDEINFTDPDIDCGMGNIYLQGTLLGKTIIDCGMGNIDLDIEGSSDDYNLKVDKGLGNLRVNGEKYSGVNWGNITAKNYLDIDGGVGNIDINFN